MVDIIIFSLFDWLLTIDQSFPTAKIYSVISRIYNETSFQIRGLMEAILENRYQNTRAESLKTVEESGVNVNK